LAFVFSVECVGLSCFLAGLAHSHKEQGLLLQALCSAGISAIVAVYIYARR
jgi:hypothetical protein